MSIQKEAWLNREQRDHAETRSREASPAGETAATPPLMRPHQRQVANPNQQSLFRTGGATCSSK